MKASSYARQGGMKKPKRSCAGLFRALPLSSCIKDTGISATYAKTRGATTKEKNGIARQLNSSRRMPVGGYFSEHCWRKREILRVPRHAIARLPCVWKDLLTKRT